MEKVTTEKAFPAAGPYTQAILVPPSTPLLFLSGCIPGHPDGSVVPPDTPIATQTALACENFKQVLEAAGSALDKVVKVNVFLTDMANFAAMNEVYERYFAHRPARSCVAVKELPKGVGVEVEGVAMK